MTREDEGIGEVFTGACPGRLLLGLNGESLGLRSQLGDDVVHPGQIGPDSASCSSALRRRRS
jgi:hypothetical protein